MRLVSHSFGLLVSALWALMPACASAQALPGTFAAKSMTASKLAALSAPGTTSQPSAATNRPFRIEPENEVPGLTFNPAAASDAIPGSCAASSNTLCYDYRTGRAVYRPARNLMPEISGMKRESLSVKRDKIVLHYSF